MERGGGTPSSGGGIGLPGMREYHDRNWQGSTPASEAGPGQGSGCGGLVLHLCLPEMREGKYGDDHGEGVERAELHPRQLCHARGCGTSHGAEVCHGLSLVPAGTGTETPEHSSVTANHVQLAAVAAEHLLAPVYDLPHEELLKRDVLHADETTLQVLHEPGKSARATAIHAARADRLSARNTGG
jgi:hypothetical protein